MSLPASADKKVDIFYLYPTAWKKTDSGAPNVCSIDDPSMRLGAKAAFERQATAFETVGNIYAPYYRQFDAGYFLTSPLKKQAEISAGIPKTDAIAAFDYYIEHYNKGRPFILAGHSQGAIMLKYILSGYMKEHPEVYRRMIAAYVIGYSVTKEYMTENPHLRFAEGPDDTGVIISYNTEAPNVKEKNPVLLSGAIAINPITWTRGEELAPASENLGSILIHADGTVIKDKNGNFIREKNYADARVDKSKGVVICSTADSEKLPRGNALFAKGLYHSYDYPFYYYNIRENAANRTKKYLSRQAEK